MSPEREPGPERWIVIPGWHRYQHYKNRMPPWIKLHASILYDDDVLKLTERQQGIYLKLLLAYSQAGGKVPATPSVVAQLTRSTYSLRDQKAFCNRGLVEIALAPCLQDASTMLASRASPRSREAEGEVVEAKPLPTSTDSATNDPAPTTPSQAPSPAHTDHEKALARAAVFTKTQGGHYPGSSLALELADRYRTLTEHEITIIIETHRNGGEPT